MIRKDVAFLHSLYGCRLDLYRNDHKCNDIIIIVSIIIIIDIQYIAMSARYIQYIAFNRGSARFLNIVIYREKNRFLNKFPFS